MGRYVLVVALLVGLSDSAFARDDGRYADNPLKYWFDNLSSGNGMCCSFADGFSVSDVDWDVEDGHYRVRLHGEWIHRFPARSIECRCCRRCPCRARRLLDHSDSAQLQLTSSAR